MGAKLDAKANARGGPLISAGDSRIPLYVVPTDEELMIAQHTASVLMRSGRSL
jgi:acetate kinase